MPTLKEHTMRLQSEFYRHRLDTDVTYPLNKVVDNTAPFLDAEGKVRMKNRFTPTFLGDPSRGDIPGIIDGRYLNVVHGNIQVIEVAPVAGIPNALALMPAGERWEILQIMAWLACSGDAADRVNGIEIAPYTPGGVTGQFVETTTITLTANQAGGHFMSANNDHWTNTNDVIDQVADENPLPIILDYNSTVVLNSTNVQATDELSIAVWYREVQP